MVLQAAAYENVRLKIFHKRLCTRRNVQYTYYMSNNDNFRWHNYIFCFIKCR